MSDKHSKKQYHLLKSEPDMYSIDDLEVDKRTPWTGVRNFMQLLPVALVW